MFENLETLLFATRTPFSEIVLRLGIALLLSIGVGYERETSNKPAGLRTHMLVGLAACTFTIVAMEMVYGLGDATAAGSVNADPTRVIEAIITGVAFLGAGTIIGARDRVVGITTGASIWLVGAIGLACGGGYYAIAVIVLLFALFTLIAVSAFEKRVMKKDDGP